MQVALTLAVEKLILGNNDGTMHDVQLIVSMPEEDFNFLMVLFDEARKHGQMVVKNVFEQKVDREGDVF